MPSKYLLLKCVGPDDRMWEQPFRVLRLSELQRLVEADSELRWGLDPRGPISSKNSDGTIVTLHPHPGFSFVASADPAAFYICYEFYEGLSIHTERDVRVHRKAARFAKELGAKVFEI
jgi:hypothetical protein